LSALFDQTSQRELLNWMRVKSARAGTDAAKASATAEVAKASGFSRFMGRLLRCLPLTFYQRRIADAVPSIPARRSSWPRAVKPPINQLTARELL
jgi:hypothetical protein